MLHQTPPVRECTWTSSQVITSSRETTRDAPSLSGGGASWHETWGGSSGWPCRGNTGNETASPLYGCEHASPDWISWGTSCHSIGKHDPAQTQATRATGAWLPLPLTPCHAPRREEASQHHALYHNTVSKTATTLAATGCWGLQYEHWKNSALCNPLHHLTSELVFSLRKK